MENTINILCATDNNYVPYCGIMLSSLFENNKTSHIDVYIIVDKPLPLRSQKQFSKLASKYGNTINYLVVDNSLFAKYPTKVMDYWSIAIYYRLCAAELLPKSVEKILYLDCDIIVTGNISSLFELDIKDKALGVVPDIFEQSGYVQHRLGYPIEGGYFNSGVLLINVDYWRKYKVGQQCLNFLENHYDLIEANDQDILNAVLWDKKLSLPITYNFQVQFLADYFFNQYSRSLQEEILTTKQNPIIIHYAVPIKPWNILYYKMPYRRIWWCYCRKSLWRYLLPTLPQRKTINYIIKRFILWPLGLMWTPKYTIAPKCNKL